MWSGAASRCAERRGDTSASRAAWPPGRAARCTAALLADGRRRCRSSVVPRPSKTSTADAHARAAPRGRRWCVSSAAERHRRRRWPSRCGAWKRGSSAMRCRPAVSAAAAGRPSRLRPRARGRRHPGKGVEHERHLVAVKPLVTSTPPGATSAAKRAAEPAQQERRQVGDDDARRRAGSSVPRSATRHVDARRRRRCGATLSAAPSTASGSLSSGEHLAARRAAPRRWRARRSPCRRRCTRARRRRASCRTRRHEPRRLVVPGAEAHRRFDDDDDACLGTGRGAPRDVPRRRDDEAPDVHGAEVLLDLHRPAFVLDVDGRDVERARPAPPAAARTPLSRAASVVEVDPPVHAARVLDRHRRRVVEGEGETVVEVRRRTTCRARRRGRAPARCARGYQPKMSFTRSKNGRSSSLGGAPVVARSSSIVRRKLLDEPSAAPS